MTTLRLVLGDQLSKTLASLRDAAPGDVILLCEVQEEATYVRHHQQKITLVLSAMRHFAARLAAAGQRVDYVRLDDPDNSGSLAGELGRAVRRHRPTRIVLTEPGEWRVLQMLQGLEAALGVPVDIRPDDRFLCSTEAFAAWAGGRKQLRMEYFYREMRRRSGWLMDGDQPLGGQWNFDAEHRKRLPAGTTPPARTGFEPDAVTREVMTLVAARFGEHFGRLENFCWAVTREQALQALAHFIADCLPGFGDYQDAMASGQDFLYHAVLSPYLNIGLLEPREVCEAAIAALDAGHAPLNAVEGFVRQVLGWREYVRGIYWLKMPAYASVNELQAQRPLPALFWTGDTDMRCLAETIDATRRNAWAHHIQRLMITGNFALIAGIDPAAVNDWYMVVYADAFEWVELPNVSGMTLFADGGMLASKPYAASGAYINRMSDYCRGCRYKVTVKNGPQACPFNYLYWHFLLENEDRLRGNPRLAMPYRNLDRMDGERRAAVRADAARLFAQLGMTPT